MLQKQGQKSRIKLCIGLGRLAVLVCVYVYFVLILPPYDKDKYKAIVFEDEGMVYQGEVYTSYPLFYEVPYVYYADELTLLSWHYRVRALRATSAMFSYTEDHPNYIIYDECIFIADSFDYTKEVFRVDEGNISVVLSDVTTGDCFSVDTMFRTFEDQQKFTFLCEKHPFLKTTVFVFYYENDYFLHFSNVDVAYRVSDEFWDLLIAHGLIDPAHVRPRNAAAPPTPGDVT